MYKKIIPIRQVVPENTAFKQTRKPINNKTVLLYYSSKDFFE